MDDWQELTLGEFATLQRGHDLPSQHREFGTVPIMGSFGVTGYHSTAAEKGPGVTVGRSGASIGVVSYVDEDYWPLNTSLFVKNFNGNNRRFVYYFLKTLPLSSFNSGSAVPSLNRNLIHPIKIVVPTHIEQNTIARLLGALDDKIENDRRMNEAFEDMARAIFKSWFVDFDPVRAKAEGKQPAHMDSDTAALFPNSFGDDGLPLGWHIAKIKEVCSVLGGYAFKSKEFVNEGMPVVKIKNISGSGDVTLDGAQCVSSQSILGKEKFRLEDGDLLIAMTGATVGKTGILTDGALAPYLNQRVGKFVVHESAYKWAIWAHLQFQQNIDAVVATGTGSAQTNISASGIVSVKWVRAQSEIYHCFNDIVSPYFDLWILNKHQNKTLANLRDTLLPKLMSGEVCVKDAEQEMGLLRDG